VEAEITAAAHRQGNPKNTSVQIIDPGRTPCRGQHQSAGGGTEATSALPLNAITSMYALNAVQETIGLATVHKWFNQQGLTSKMGPKGKLPSPSARNDNQLAAPLTE